MINTQLPGGKTNKTKKQIKDKTNKLPISILVKVTQTPFLKSAAFFKSDIVFLSFKSSVCSVFPLHYLQYVHFPFKSLSIFKTSVLKPLSANSIISVIVGYFLWSDISLDYVLNFSPLFISSNLG